MIPYIIRMDKFFVLFGVLSIFCLVLKDVIKFIPPSSTNLVSASRSFFILSDTSKLGILESIFVSKYTLFSFIVIYLIRFFYAFLRIPVQLTIQDHKPLLA